MIKKIKSPELLLNLFSDYAAHTKKNPILKQDFVGRAGMEVFRQLERPLTMVGFGLYCSKKKVIYGLKNYFANTGGAYDEYQDTCHRIKSMIRQDQIEGGMIGIYNPSITQRLNGLSEKVKQTVTEQPQFKYV